MRAIMNEKFEVALQGFLKAAQAKVDAGYAGLTNYAVLSVQPGTKYVKIVATSHGSKSVYCFVNKETGNVHKAASWKAPVVSNPRSNIYSADFGASGVTQYGAVYLKG